MDKEHISIKTDSKLFIRLPEQSKWNCYLFGNRQGGTGIVYKPSKGNVPNLFVRWMMRICFDCKWVKESEQLNKGV